MAEKVIGVLALQGAFREHEQMLTALGASFREIRQPEDLTEEIAGIILPGGESTAQRKLLVESGLFAPLQKRIQAGMPVLATCAGLILLARELSNDGAGTLGTLPVRVQRNAYGRQLGSFAYRGSFGALPEVSMPFIRAPYIEKILHPEVQVLSTCQGRITGVAYKKQLAMAFHPELTTDVRIHQQFMQML